MTMSFLFSEERLAMLSEVQTKIKSHTSFQQGMLIFSILNSCSHTCLKVYILNLFESHHLSRPSLQLKNLQREHLMWDNWIIERSKRYTFRYLLGGMCVCVTVITIKSLNRSKFNNLF